MRKRSGVLESGSVCFIAAAGSRGGPGNPGRRQILRGFRSRLAKAFVSSTKIEPFPIFELARFIKTDISSRGAGAALCAIRQVRGLQAPRLKKYIFCRTHFLRNDRNLCSY